MLKLKPMFIESVAVRGGNGKTMTANRLRDHFLAANVPVQMVRIESKRAMWTPQDNEIFIATENLAESNDEAGGVASVLAPMWQAIDQSLPKNGVVICDWGAGLTDFRAELMGATRFDELLKGIGVAGYACVVMDNAVDSMRQGADTLKRTREAAPGLQLVVVRNELRGTFDYVQGTEEARALAGVMEQSTNVKHITIPAFRGKAMAPFAAAGLTVLEVMTSDPHRLAASIGRDIFVTTSCVSKVAEWWKRTEIEVARVFPIAADGVA